MRMIEAKKVAAAAWGDAAVVFNGKPDSAAPTYKVGRNVLVDGKPAREWLGVGLDWDRAFLAAGIAPEKIVHDVKHISVALRAALDAAAGAPDAPASKPASKKASKK
jgi:hypothetical protein